METKNKRWRGQKIRKGSYDWSPKTVPLNKLITQANSDRLNAEEKLFEFYNGISKGSRTDDVLAKARYDHAWAIFNALTELKTLKDKVDPVEEIYPTLSLYKGRPGQS